MGQGLIFGTDMIKNPEQARAYFGYMEQKFSLFSTLSVIQNLKFFSDIYGLRGNQRENHIKKMIEVFELSLYLKQQAGNLPLGFKQRLTFVDYRYLHDEFCLLIF